MLNPDEERKLELRGLPETGIYVEDLTKVSVKSVKEIDQVMKRGAQNRSTGKTNMNEKSSRSHSVFTIVIETMESVSGGKPTVR